jgi:diaminohydroxyphosphoribosylaminopyrimidine deaminase/5-amino-6-(5-phosphoribosylamino)uracil reductase
MAPKSLTEKTEENRIRIHSDNSVREKKDSVRAYWLSTQPQNRLNHRWRTEEAAILVGSETYLRDHPSLTARHFLGPQPQPVVLDRRGRLGDVPAHWLHLHTQTVEETLEALYEKKIQSVIVEGGRQILDAFIASGLYDEVRILRSSQRLGAGLEAPAIPPSERLTIID